MTTAEGAFNEMLFGVTVAMMKEYAETRVGQGATTEQLNAELADRIPQINAWSRRQRKLFKLKIEMISANSMTMQ